ncbi:MAG TPA: pilus assembly protein TadG-related protein, partial [Pirellulales bacterium]
MRYYNSHRSRRGAIAVLACFLMIGLLGLVAFAVDLGYLANSQTELQRTADATALAACIKLQYDGTPGTPVNLSGNIANVPTTAAQYAALNTVCAAPPTLSSSDVVIGYMANPGSQGATLDTSADSNSFNSVQVTVRRSSDTNGLVPAFFSRIFGLTGEAASASATAAFIGNIQGFKAPLVVQGTPGSGGNLMILPFALDRDTWNALQLGTGSDVWTWDPVNHCVVSGADGILECNLFPQGIGSPGNRGTVSIGCSNGTSNLVRQIEYGLSASDLEPYGG